MFIFKIGSTLTTASASNVSLINSASACRVFWQVGSSATLGTNSTLVGNVLALTSVTADTGASIYGRLLARNAAVTLQTTNAQPTCAGAVPRIAVTKTASPSSRPEPGGSFNFTVKVTNNGVADGDLTKLVDDVYGDLNGLGTCATGGTIPVGNSYSCVFSGSFTGVAGDSQTDTVTATLLDANQATAMGPAQATVRLPPPGMLEICTLPNHANAP